MSDVVVLVVHFIILFLLSLYGLHRYHLAWIAINHRKSPHLPRAEESKNELPTVTVQLPVFNERYVVERLIEAVCLLKYPNEKLEIQILDDSTDDTQSIAQKCCEMWSDKGRNIRYIHREARTGYKAGALEYGTRLASGEFLVVFDADFIPKEDFLEQVIPHFEDPTVGMVQTRWTHLNRSQNNATRAQAILLDGHFLIEHFARNRSGKFFNFNGTAGAWRREAILNSGGWHHETLTEDLDLSYRAQLKGWRFIYLDDVTTPAELPADINAFKTQQHRWAKGSIQVCLKLLPTILKSHIPWRVKLEAFIHLTNNFAYVLMLLMSILMPLALHVRISNGWHHALYLDLPVFFGATVSIVFFYIIGQLRSGENWRKNCLDLPMTLAIGIGLSVNNTLAVIEACVGHKTPFVRTPKFAHCSEGNRSIRTHKYRTSLNMIPFVEIGVSIIYFYCVIYCVWNHVWTAFPFMLLFACGYGYVGFASLIQGLLMRRNSKRPIPSQNTA